MPTRSACVIAGVSPQQATGMTTSDRVAVRPNRLGALVTGRIDGLAIDYAFRYPGPVYDVMWNADTGWFVVTIYRGAQAERWHNRDAADAGYPAVADVLGATTPRAILDALDVPPDAIGYPTD
jgi:hypothetical protein